MALVQRFLEGGTNGAALSNALSGSSTASVGGGTQVFATSMAAHGTLGASFTNAASNGTYRRWEFTGAATPTVWSFSGIVTLPASAWPVTVQVAQFPVAAGTAGQRSIQVNGTGQVAFGGNTNVIGTTLTFGNRYRFTVTANGSTAQQIKVYSESPTGVWETQVGSTGSTAHVDFASAVVGVDLGVTTSPGANVVTVGWDDIQLNDGSATEISDYSPPGNTLPTVGAGTDQNVNTGATVTLTGTATDSDGTISSTVWTQLSGPSVSLSGTGLSRTFTPSTAGVYTFRLTATDNAGGSAADDVVVNVRGVSATPNVLTSNAGGWTNEGGAASLVAALGDSNDATYGQTPDNPSAAVAVVTLAPLQAGVVTVTTRDRATVASPVITRTVSILDGSASVLGTTSFALTTTWANHAVATGSPVAAGATVRVQVSDTQAA